MVHDPSSLPPELIAIAFVVENTDTVSKAWLNTLRDYVSPPLKRLINAYGIPLRIGVVSYGATDSLASPLSCKRFFAEQTQMTATLRTNSESLGIGTTAPAFNKGLASLEALVAAVELFDDLDQSHKGDPTANPPQAPRRVIKHIIHVAAAWPDGASVPSHNHDPNLDEVTWDTLPAELKKRNLNYNAILLRPQGTDSQYVKLHHALGQSTDSWFAVRPEHTLLLSKYPDPPKLPTPAPVHTAQQLQLLKQRQQQVAQALAQKQLEQQQQKQQAAQNAKQQQPPSLPSQAPSSKRPNESTENGAEPTKRPRLADSIQNLQALSSGSPAPSATPVVPAAAGPAAVAKPPVSVTPQVQAPPPPQPPTGQQPPMVQQPQPGQASQIPPPPNVAQLPPGARERFRNPEAHRKIQYYMVTEGLLAKRLFEQATELKQAGRNEEARAKLEMAQQTRMKHEGWKRVMEWAGLGLNPALGMNPQQAQGQGQVAPQGQGQGQAQPTTNSGGAGANGNGNEQQQPVNRLASPFKPVPAAPPVGQRVMSQSPAQNGPGPSNPSPYPGQPPPQGFMGQPSQPLGAGGPGQVQDPQIGHQLAKMMEQNRNRALSQPQGPMAQGQGQPGQQPRFPIQNNMNLNSMPGATGPMGMGGQGPGLGQGQGGHVQPTAQAFAAQMQAQYVQLHNVLRQSALQNEPQMLPQQNPQMPAQTNGPVPVWVGGMKWSGSGQDGMKKEVSCRIQVLSKSPGMCYARTWPDTFHLVPTRQLHVGREDLMRWVKQYSPAMAYVLPLGDQHRPAYNQFVNLLADKNVYATAAWTTPTSSQTSNVLFFMMNGVLTGAFFPLTGIPDMPKPFGSNTAPVTEQRRFALTGQAFPGMPGGGPASTGMVPAGGAGPGGMSGGGPNRLAQGQQLLPLGDVVANFPQYVSMVKARFPTGHATAELKAKLVDDLRRLQMLQQAQKAAAAPWDASGGMGGPAGGNHGGAGMSNVGQNPGMPNMGNNPAAMQNMAAMAAMGMGMGGMGGMNPVNSSNNAGNAGGAGAQGFNFMNAGMNMGFGHGGS